MIINIVLNFLFNLEGVIFIISQMTFVWRGVAGRSPAVQTTLPFVFLLVLMIFMQRLPRCWRYLFLIVNNKLKTKGVEGNQISKADTQWPFIANSIYYRAVQHPALPLICVQMTSWMDNLIGRNLICVQNGQFWLAKCDFENWQSRMLDCSIQNTIWLDSFNHCARFLYLFTRRRYSMI